MKTTASKTNSHLLEGSVEWLHRQTTEWQCDVEFWREELIFFYHLLKMKVLPSHVPMQEVAVLEKELVKLSGEDLKALQTELGKHEVKLGSVTERNAGQGELDYRHDHKVIMFHIHAFESKVRDFKKSVFELVKN